MVETTLNYLAGMAEKPVYWFCKPPPGTPWRNTRGDRRSLPIHDARTLAPPASLDVEGFALVEHATAAGDLRDERNVVGGYYAEAERLVAQATGASRVLAFDHNLRCGSSEGRDPSSARGSGIQAPVRFVHNDYTESSAPQRVRDLLPDEAEHLLRHRFSVVNVWKPIGGPVREAPLAFCDARTLRMDDFVPTDLRYPDRVGEVYSLQFRPEHRWFYYPEMREDEVLLLKCFDSDRSCARFTAHSAFDDPTSADDAPARESVEVRTLVFFAPPA